MVTDKPISTRNRMVADAIFWVRRNLLEMAADIMEAADDCYPVTPEQWAKYQAVVQERQNPITSYGELDYPGFGTAALDKEWERLGKSYEQDVLESFEHDRINPGSAKGMRIQLRCLGYIVVGGFGARSIINSERASGWSPASNSSVADGDFA